MHDLKEHLHEASAIDLAGMQGVAKRAIRALHTDTFFALSGQQDFVRTSPRLQTGRFFRWCGVRIPHGQGAEIFRSPTCDQEHLLQLSPATLSLTSMHKVSRSNQQWSFRWLVPCWMDDLAITTHGQHQWRAAHEPWNWLQLAAILDLFQSHAMTPNLNKGKDRNPLQTKRQMGREQFSDNFLDPMLQGSSLPLENMEPTRWTLWRSTSIWVALRTFQETYVKKLNVGLPSPIKASTNTESWSYQNTDLAPARRTEIFNSLILSRLLFGAETWFIQDQKTKDYLHSAIMRLYKRLLRCPSDSPRFWWRSSS